MAAGLAMGRALPEAVNDAVEYVQDCLRNSLAHLLKDTWGYSATGLDFHVKLSPDENMDAFLLSNDEETFRGIV